MSIDIDLLRQAYHDSHGNVTQTARLLGVSRTGIYPYIKKGMLEDLVEKPSVVPQIHGKINPSSTEKRPLPKKGHITRYLLTSAQNNTKLNEKVWHNLCKLAEHYEAEIFVGTYTYNLNMYGKQAIKFGTESPNDNALWFDDRLLPFMAKVDNKNIELAPDLIWCGRANILPTAERPLSGFETYTGRSSSIFPHAKIALQSIPSCKKDKIKINYTTGTITQRNYVQKKAGLKSELHHSYGALLVEICPDGSWFVRQINADYSGTLYDLDVKVHKSIVTCHNNLLAINWGDIHVFQREDSTYKAAWGVGGMLDVLQPKYQFMHDLLDFHARNHHQRDHHSLFSQYSDGTDSVEKEMNAVGEFLAWADRTFCQTVVVESNHDGFFEKWLREGDYRNDPVNAIYFLEAQLAKYRALANGCSLNLVEWAMGRLPGLMKKRIRYLNIDESFVIADAIECGMHGHLGPNGARGGSRSLARIGRKANIGHSHSAEIHDGLYVAGVSGKLDHGYNVGPSSWSHSHVITYPNGKRAIITVVNGKWRG